MNRTDFKTIPSKTQEQFEIDVKNLVGDEYSVIGNYINARTKILIRHNICNREFPVTPHNFLSCGNRCPLCKKDRWHGKGHPTWKNGISSLHKYLRCFINEWKNDVFKKYNYTCAVSGIKDCRFQIHHLYNYTKLIKDVLNELHLEVRENIGLYSDTELESIKETFVKKHILDIGVCIAKPIHKLFHHIYGNRNNSVEQFRDFVNKYKNYEFDDLLDDKYKYCNRIKEIS